MSCSLKSKLLSYSGANQQASKKTSLPEKPVIVPVFCACMIALQGSGAGMAHIGMVQQTSDAVTEHITIIQKQFFTNSDLDKNLRG